jgi:hypothetical protein
LERGGSSVFGRGRANFKVSFSFETGFNKAKILPEP